MSVAKRVVLAFAVCWIPGAAAGVAQVRVQESADRSGGNVRAEAPLKSGPPVGAENDRSGFRPQFVAGPSTGRSLCPV
jgi:hypothetical protein